MTDEERIRLREHIIKVIEEQGSAFVQNEASYLGIRFGGHQHESFSSWMVASGEFIRTKHPNHDSYHISRNPSHSLDENIKATNVALQKSLKGQKSFGRWSLVLTAISIIFIGISANLQYRDKTDTELINLKDQLKESMRSIDSIATYQREINLSIQEIIDTIKN